MHGVSGHLGMDGFENSKKSFTFLQTFDFKQDLGPKKGDNERYALSAMEFLTSTSSDIFFCKTDYGELVGSVNLCRDTYFIASRGKK